MKKCNCLKIVHETVGLLIFMIFFGGQKFWSKKKIREKNMKSNFFGCCRLLIINNGMSNFNGSCMCTRKTKDIFRVRVI